MKNEPPLFSEGGVVTLRKVRAAVDAGLIPLVRVGEPEGVRRCGGAQQLVTAQVRAALSGLVYDEVAGTIVAYKPMWAIGEAGRPATPEEVSAVLLAVRRELDRSSNGRGPLALLYGGSVTTGKQEPRSTGHRLTGCSWAALSGTSPGS